MLGRENGLMVEILQETRVSQQGGDMSKEPHKQSRGLKARDVTQEPGKSTKPTLTTRFQIPT